MATSKKAATPKPKITSTLKVLGKTYKGGGKTVEEAVSSLKPAFSRAPGILTLSKNKISREKVLRPQIVSRAFGPGSPSLQGVVKRQIATMFNKKDFE